MDTEKFYKLWEKYSKSEIMDKLPEDLEEFCKKHQITVDYFIEEFL